MGEDAAIEALTGGATDYVLKVRLSRLAPAIKRALHEAEDRRERKRAEDALRQSEREKTILNRILGVFLTVSDEEVYGGVLSVVLDAMESRFGRVRLHSWTTETGPSKSDQRCLGRMPGH